MNPFELFQWLLCRFRFFLPSHHFSLSQVYCVQVLSLAYTWLFSHWSFIQTYVLFTLSVNYIVYRRWLLILKLKLTVTYWCIIQVDQILTFSFRQICSIVQALVLTLTLQSMIYYTGLGYYLLIESMIVYRRWFLHWLFTHWSIIQVWVITFSLSHEYSVQALLLTLTLHSFIYHVGLG